MPPGFRVDFRDLPALYISSPPKIHSPPYSSGAAGLLFSHFQVSKSC